VNGAHKAPSDSAHLLVAQLAIVNQLFLILIFDFDFDV
jgi:hypothetical protein